MNYEWWISDVAKKLPPADFNTILSISTGPKKVSTGGASFPVRPYMVSLYISISTRIFFSNKILFSKIYH